MIAVKRMKMMILLQAVALILPIIATAAGSSGQAVVSHIPPARGPGDEALLFSPLMGEVKQHCIQERETLLDIARRYDLGFNEIADLYPQLDPWIPPFGRRIKIPSQWISPQGNGEGIVVNLPEMRLYWFNTHNRAIATFPISIGQKARPTPEGTFAISNKIVHPAWSVPPSLTHKYTFRSLPPGPDNPLGDFWLGLGQTRLGIHGTDFPWSIGRAVTQGCIRLYPEDIQRLFALVQPGTPVTIIYSPVKIALHGERILTEVHRDIYGRISDFQRYGNELLQRSGLVSRVDLENYRRALEKKGGIPIDVTRPFIR